MIDFLAGVATGFCLIGAYGLCVRQWEERRLNALFGYGEVPSGRPPLYVRAWNYIFE